MNTILSNKKAFKPVFLYSNEDYSKRLIDKLRAEQENIKNAILSIKKIRPHLKDEVIYQCLLNGFNHLDNIIRKDHPDYPHADLKILLSLESGLKPNLVDEVIANLSKIKKNQLIEYNISGVEVTLKPETIKNIEKEALRYTDTQEQNEALELLTNIAENMNKAIESGLITSEKIGSNLGFTKGLTECFGGKMKLKNLDCGLWGVAPDPFKISTL